MKLGGIVGTATYSFEDSNLEALFLPWLLVGEYVHIGKGATFGLGSIGIQAERHRGPARRRCATKERSR